MTDFNKKQKRWDKRRQVIHIVIGFCMFGILAIGMFGSDNGLHNGVVAGLFLTLNSTLGSYIFGATWDDKNHRDHDNV